MGVMEGGMMGGESFRFREGVDAADEGARMFECVRMIDGV